jgi:hypothetical protein
MGILGSLFNMLTGDGGRRGSPPLDRGNSGTQVKPQTGGFPPRQQFFCKHCGMEYSNVRDLTINQCPNHPAGQGRRHELYEGSVKSQYTCKYCGASYRSLRDLTCNLCQRHPAGRNHRHEPAL